MKLSYRLKSTLPACIAVALALLAFGSVCRPAYAGPPFITDDPEPVELHHYEFYISSLYSGDKAGYSTTAPHVELNYGAANNLQLHIIAPMVLARPFGGSTQYGYGDTELGAKYRFVQETKSSPQVGVFPLVELPTGDASRGLGSGQTAFFLPVWIQKSWGPWMSYGGGGYWSNPGIGNQNYWFTGWLLQRQITKRLAVGGEIFYLTASAVGGGSRTGVNLGGTYDFDEGHHLLFSAGDDIHGSGRGMAYLGYQWTWGEKKPEPAK